MSEKLGMSGDTTDVKTGWENMTEMVDDSDEGVTVDAILAEVGEDGDVKEVANQYFEKMQESGALSSDVLKGVIGGLPLDSDAAEEMEEYWKGRLADESLESKRRREDEEPEQPGFEAEDEEEAA